MACIAGFIATLQSLRRPCEKQGPIPRDVSCCTGGQLLFANHRLWLWVPAFAGTTEISYVVFDILRGFLLRRLVLRRLALAQEAAEPVMLFDAKAAIARHSPQGPRPGGPSSAAAAGWPADPRAAPATFASWSRSRARRPGPSRSCGARCRAG